MFVMRHRAIAAYTVLANLIIFGFNYSVFLYFIVKYGDQFKYVIAIASAFMVVVFVKTVERYVRSSYHFSEPKAIGRMTLPNDSMWILLSWLGTTFVVPGIVFGIILFFLRKMGIDVSQGSSVVIVNVPLGLYVSGLSLRNLQYYTMSSEDSAGVNPWIETEE